MTKCGGPGYFCEGGHNRRMLAASVFSMKVRQCQKTEERTALRYVRSIFPVRNGQGKKKSLKMGGVRDPSYRNRQTSANDCHDDDERINMTEDLDIRPGPELHLRAWVIFKKAQKAFHKRSPVTQTTISEFKCQSLLSERYKE